VTARLLVNQKGAVKMRIFPRKNQPVLAYVLGFGFVALAGQANAGCLSGLAEAAAPSRSSTPSAPPSSPPLIQAAYYPDQPSAPKFLRASDRNDGGDDNEPIVGLWQFVLNGGMDFGTQAWHADGTELMFSAGRDPAKGDICQGVWRKIGPRTYTLNHIAMGYDDGFPGPLYRVHIHATVKVDRAGKSFSGMFDALVCINDTTHPFQEDPNTCLTPPKGSISGALVQPD
jgi:hypothetical protein